MLRNKYKLVVGSLGALLITGAMTLKTEAANPSGSVNMDYQMNTILYDSCLKNTRQSGGEIDGLLSEIRETAKSQESVQKDALSQSSEAEKIQNLLIAKADKYVNIRKTPDIQGEIVGKIYNKGVGDLLSVQDGWYEIESGSVNGYIKADYCIIGSEAQAMKYQVGTPMAKVTADGLYIRKEPSTDSKILGMIAFEDEVEVLVMGEGWLKVDTEEGEGWISSQYVSQYTDFTYAESIEEEKARKKKEEEERNKARAAAQERTMRNEAPSNNKVSFVLEPASATITGDSESGKAVVEYALQFVGNPYVYGGSSLTEGTDCSGFVMRVYEEFGVTLPHSSSADRKQGSKVDSLEEAQAGDIICYSGHVALYIGDGKIVHAANQEYGIVVSPVDYKKILAIRRIF